MSNGRKLKGGPLADEAKRIDIELVVGRMTDYHVRKELVRMQARLPGGGEFNPGVRMSKVGRMWIQELSDAVNNMLPEDGWEYEE